MQTTAEYRTKEGRAIFWDVSCRRADDWYVSVYPNEIIADHLPSYEAAIAAAPKALLEKYGPEKF